MDREKILDTVTRHMLWQGEAARGPEGGCLYETEAGLKCAIGCLIPDDHPALSEAVFIRNLLDRYPDLVELWDVKNDSDINFLKKLQMIHDFELVDTWKQRLAEVDCG